MSEHLSFGPYRFEPLTARLWNGKREIRVTRKAAGVLGVLVAHAGQPVTKQELFASVWRDTIVSDDALVSCVQELRKALGDDARHPRFIETRHRSGYRFVASVTPPGNAPRAATAVSAQDAAAIAVLPFTNLSPERDQDYFCEGLADELIDALSHVEGLRVAARSCAFQFRGIGIDVREVGRRLGVGSLLEGSVRRDGTRLRVTVQLVDVASGFHRWSQRFEKPLGDVFAIQDEIAESVATNLRGSALSGHERHALQRPHTATEAYNFYLRGRQHLHRMRRPDLAQSRRMFERAIELDAGYAPAWAGLATVHATVFEWWGAQGEDLRRAEEASVVAMQASPELADAHVARGLALSLRREYDQAQLHFEAAARINPNLFDAYYYHARTCFERGDVQRSADLFHKAAQVRLEDFQSPSLLAQSLRMLGRIEEAHAAARECVARAQRALELNPLEVRALSLGSLALYECGQPQRAMEWSRRSLDIDPDDMSALVNAACLRCRMGVKEEALDLLERVFSRGWGHRDWIDNDPDYDSLRDDPRFKRLLAQLK